jgi:colanic acid biosynthesis glycosyl transferase WcaI
MNILLYGIHYAPELTGIGKYSGELGDYLSDRGHQVDVVTAFPFYPNWNIQIPYTGRWWKKERGKQGEHIVRCPLYVPKKNNSSHRILHEFSFLLSSTLALLPYLFRPIDRVVTIVTPFHLGIPARLFAWLKGIPMWYHIQDLQIDAARELGMIQQANLLQLLTNMERWTLKNSDVVSTISVGMERRISNKGIPAQEIVQFPNWVDVAHIRPMTKEESFRSQWGFKTDDHLVMYAGNLGEKQGLEQLIEVAQQLREQSTIHFLIVGEGSSKERLQQMATAQQLTNIHFYPLQDYAYLSQLLATADLHLVLQKRAAADLVMPSKFTTLLAAGACTIVTADRGSTLYDIIERAQLAVCIAPESSAALATAILELLQKDRQPFQLRARTYALQHLDREIILSRFEQQLLAL